MANLENSEQKSSPWLFIFIAGAAAFNLFLFVEAVLTTIENPTLTAVNLAGTLFLAILALKIKL